MKTLRRFRNRAFIYMRTLAAIVLFSAAAAMVLVAASPGGGQTKAKIARLTPKFTNSVALDVSPALRDLRPPATVFARPFKEFDMEIRPERGRRELENKGYSPDGALQRSPRARTAAPAPSIPGPVQNFEGLSNEDNFSIFGGRVNPPDNMGAVGPNHYVELINIILGIYDKSGNKLVGPIDIGALWANFAVPDCTDPSGDPVVIYDQFTDRWILSQFTTSGLDDPNKPFWNCVAVSTTGDPTGTYYRYAFETAHFQFFPDYPKYGLWTDSYVITTREFGPTIEYGIGVYALEKNKMVNGQPARSVSFFIDGNDPDLLPLVGDGLLPAYADGKQKPKNDSAIPIVGTQDNDAVDYGGTVDAINIFDLRVQWNAGAAANASLVLAPQLPTAAFDSIFPCGPDSRDCLPQPGITNSAQYLDFLSRQRPTWRLAYRNFKDHESLVTNQQVEALPGVAGVRWYEIRRDGTGTYSIYQQGTYAPNDGVHRWMGSVAQDKQGNILLGYSVVNGTTVFPGIRYTGRLAGDPLGQMTLGEGTVINGSGVQTTTNSRWGDYTSMNVDPTDDCTFWYVNEYYAVSGTPANGRPWQTRIASIKLPSCH
jgi:hypothetical protein